MEDIKIAYRKILDVLSDYRSKYGERAMMDAEELLVKSSVSDPVEFKEALQSLFDEGYIDSVPVALDTVYGFKHLRLSEKTAKIVSNQAEYDKLFPDDEGTILIDEFVRNIRLSIQKTDATRDDKDSMLECLQHFAYDPVMSKILAGSLKKIARR